MVDEKSTQNSFEEAINEDQNKHKKIKSKAIIQKS